MADSVCDNDLFNVVGRVFGSAGIGDTLRQSIHLPDSRVPLVQVDLAGRLSLRRRSTPSLTETQAFVHRSGAAGS